MIHAEIESSEVSRKKEITMKRLLGLAAVLEAATGLALMIHPPLVTRLLLGDEVSGAGEALGRVAGFALVGLGLACWPGLESAGVNTPALRALLAYNLLATLYLAYLGIGGRLVGSLLWPAVVIHGVLTLLLARGWWLAPVGVERVKQ
jgi:hypothetical protein